MKKTVIVLLIAVASIGPIGSPSSDPRLVQEATAELTLIGGARGPDFWTRVSGIVSFGPEVSADSDRNLDASHGRGCLVVGTSFANTVSICEPFAPGEVVLAHNSTEHGGGVLLVNTLGRLRENERAIAIMPVLEEGMPSISPLAPVFWVPQVTPQVGEQQVRVDVTEYESTFFDVTAAYIWVNGQEAVIPDGSGIIVRGARVSERFSR